MFVRGLVFLTLGRTNTEKCYSRVFGKSELLTKLGFAHYVYRHVLTMFTWIKKVKSQGINFFFPFLDEINCFVIAFGSPYRS